FSSRSSRSACSPPWPASTRGPSKPGGTGRTGHRFPRDVRRSVRLSTLSLRRRTPLLLFEPALVGGSRRLRRPPDARHWGRFLHRRRVRSGREPPVPKRGPLVLRDRTPARAEQP